LHINSGMAPYSTKTKTRLEGRCVAITGANSGLGKVTALDLAGRGARVLLLCRSKEKTLAVASEIKTATGNEQVIFYQLDLSSLRSVRECAEEITSKEERLDILINNAGVANCPQSKTEDGFELQFGTNHLGHFLLTELLLPMLKKSATAASSGFHPRIVIVSSLAHEYGEMRWDDMNYEKKGSYGEVKAYSMSKLANLLHTKELARRLEGTGVSVYALHPGVVDTDVFRHSKAAWYGFMVSMMKPFLRSPLQGAQTSLYCAMEEGLVNGGYYVDCKEKTPHRKARDEEDQKRLWKLSEEMVGISAE